MEHKTPSLIRKMKTYLELEGKLNNQPGTNVFLPNKNVSPRKTPISKKVEKKKCAKEPVKRRFKVRVIAQSMHASPTLAAEPAPTEVTSTAATQMPVAKAAAVTTTSIPVTVYNLAQGKFKRIPYPSRRFPEGVKI